MTIGKKIHVIIILKTYSKHIRCFLQNTEIQLNCINFMYITAHSVNPPMHKV